MNWDGLYRADFHGNLSLVTVEAKDLTLGVCKQEWIQSAGVYGGQRQRHHLQWVSQQLHACQPLGQCRLWMPYYSLC